MWLKKLNKISVFLLLMSLLHICRTETTIDPIANTEITENLSYNSDKDFATTTTVVVEDEVTATTEKSIELESTTQPNNENADINTTEVPNNDENSNTEPSDKIECVCNCLANGNYITLGCSTKTAEEIEVDNSKISEGQTSLDNDSTLPTVETIAPTVKTETETSKLNAEEGTTAQTSVVSETTTEATLPICLTTGVQAHEFDCKQYYDCSLEGSVDGNFHLFTKSCPDKQAFNIELNRCSRDISSCSSLPIQCLVKGGVADLSSNSSYYLCEPRLIGVGFRIFHVDCPSNEIFYPELGKCLIDFNNLDTQGYLPINWNQIRDIDVVKAEMKLLKEQDKLELKREKEIKKAEEKLQKELEKLAKKKAKEEEKIQKEKAKQQATTVLCQQEGNIASEIGENIYYACVTKKGILKAIPMQCSFGAKFNQEVGTCINSTTDEISSVSAEDNDDDNDD